MDHELGSFGSIFFSNNNNYFACGGDCSKDILIFDARTMEQVFKI